MNTVTVPIASIFSLRHHFQDTPSASGKEDCLKKKIFLGSKNIMNKLSSSINNGSECLERFMLFVVEWYERLKSRASDVLVSLVWCIES